MRKSTAVEYPSPDGPKVGLLVSGGLDSCILLGHLLQAGYGVQPFYVRSDLAWQYEELLAVRCFTSRMGEDHSSLDRLVVLEMPMADLYEDHWSVTGELTPDASTRDDAVYLPGRNALLVLKAALWCHLHGITELALGILKANPFADATPGFFDEYAASLTRAVGAPLRILRPFASLAKAEILHLGRDFPLELTFSCLSPVAGRHCGVCNKCGERRTAFREAVVPDPTLYAAPLPPAC